MGGLLKLPTSKLPTCKWLLLKLRLKIQVRSRHKKITCGPQSKNRHIGVCRVSLVGIVMMMWGRYLMYSGTETLIVVGPHNSIP